MHRILVVSQRLRRLIFPLFAALTVALSILFSAAPARGEAMLQLFNVNWDELIQKMPEIAEAGYTSLWLPPPAKPEVSFPLAMMCLTRSTSATKPARDHAHALRHQGRVATGRRDGASLRHSRLF